MIIAWCIVVVIFGQKHIVPLLNSCQFSSSSKQEASLFVYEIQNSIRVTAMLTAWGKAPDLITQPPIESEALFDIFSSIQTV